MQGEVGKFAAHIRTFAANVSFPWQGDAGAIRAHFSDTVSLNWKGMEWKRGDRWKQMIWNLWSGQSSGQSIEHRLLASERLIRLMEERCRLGTGLERVTAGSFQTVKRTGGVGECRGRGVPSSPRDRWCSFCCCRFSADIDRWTLGWWQKTGCSGPCSSQSWRAVYYYSFNWWCFWLREKMDVWRESMRKVSIAWVSRWMCESWQPWVNVSKI